MSAPNEYKITNGRGGRVVDYEDSTDVYSFIYDLDPDSENKPLPTGVKIVLLLEEIPLKNHETWEPVSPVDQEKLKFMLSKVQEYLLGFGAASKIVPLA